LSIVHNSRTICAALQPLMGDFGTGVLTAVATGADVLLQAGTVAIPIRGGHLDEQAAVYVRRNPARADHAWLVTSGGISVTVHSLQGGTRVNMAAGTVYRWDPPITGLAATAVSAAGIAGGALSGGYAGLKQVTLYKSMTSASIQELFRAQAGQLTPSATLCRNGVQPLDGPSTPTGGSRTARAGRGRVRARIIWWLWLVTGRLDTEGERRNEGDTMLADVIDQLSDRAGFRELVVSQDPGLQIHDARPFAVNPTSYVDLVTFSSITAFSRTDTAEYNDWLLTRIRQQTPTQPDPPDPDLPVMDVPDYTIETPAP
jgi:hypothetical protein